MPLIVFPDIESILLFAPLCVFVLFGTAWIASYLKLKKGVKTNYTRKFFHFSIFSFAAFLSYVGGYPLVLLFGFLAGFFVLIAIIFGRESTLYEGIAREQDEPHRSFYIVTPFVCIAVAGVLNNLLFENFSLIGYVVTGWGDAIGEPVGARFGKHKYKVPTVTGIKCYRSIEGSIAIMSVSTLGTILALTLLKISVMFSILVVTGVVTGFIACVVEAISPHGIDNFTTQFASVLISFHMIKILI